MPCIPGRKFRNVPIKYDKRRYRSRSRIEIIFGRLKDCRRVATHYDRCPTVSFSAIALGEALDLRVERGVVGGVFEGAELSSATREN